MTDWQPAEPGDWLDHDLRNLAGTLHFPPTPEFRMPTTESPGRRLSPWRHGTGGGRRVALASLAACLLLILTLASPDVRQATADLLGFPAIRIEFGDRTGDPPPTVTSIGGTLLLGEPITLDAVSQYTTQPLLLPADRLEGMAPEVYYNGFQGVPVISLLYPASDEVPEIGSTGVGM